MCPYGTGLLGRVIDGLGCPIDGQGPLRNVRWRPLHAVVPPPLERTAIQQPFITGQRAIDGFLTLGAGQRVGLFSGSGVGKSTLLGEIARHSNSDCNVVTLIGERGREVRPFLDDVLGPLGRQRSVVVVATSDESPLLRIRAAQVAMSIAHAFRERGRHVMFLCDSITRLAIAQREIGILLNEPPTARGYPPSVFRVLTQLLEQLGTDDRGSITGILSVLVEGDDTEEPVADAVRSVVDGHVVLDRDLAERGHYPAIRISRSVSRLFDHVVSAEHRRAAQRVRQAMATYHEFADMIRMGIYQPGQSKTVDNAIALQADINAFLCQQPGQLSTFSETTQRLEQLAARWNPSDYELYLSF